MLKTIAFGITFGISTASAFAQTASDIKANPGNSSYLQDSRGIISRNSFGLCWRAGHWTPADAIPGCDGELTPPIANPIAPAIVPPEISTPAQAEAPTTPPEPKRCDFAVTLANDQTFAFDKAVLSAAARTRIDKEIMAKLANCAKIDIIRVTGHADRFGSHEYNQRLSEKRAAAVAAHLKSKGLTAPLDIRGAGNTRPIRFCDGKLRRTQLIECLAPNRRVEIEARGLAK